jgi:hypothetical protein
VPLVQSAELDDEYDRAFGVLATPNRRDTDCTTRRSKRGSLKPTGEQHHRTADCRMCYCSVELTLMIGSLLVVALALPPTQSDSSLQLAVSAGDADLETSARRIQMQHYVKKSQLWVCFAFLALMIAGAGCGQPPNVGSQSAAVGDSPCWCNDCNVCPPK